MWVSQLQLYTVVHSAVVCLIVHMLVCVLIRIMNFAVLVWYPHDEWSMPGSLAHKQQPEPIYSVWIINNPYSTLDL